MDREHTSTITSRDLEAMKQFIGALHSHLWVTTEDSDAVAGGVETSPLTAKSIERDIRTKPELRVLWNNLTQPQKDYAYNRYILNSPARLDKKIDIADPYSPAIVQDYNRLYNLKEYLNNRAAYRGANFILGGGGALDMSYLGRGLGKLTGWDRQAKASLYHLDNFGYSKYGPDDPRRLVPAPTDNVIRAADATTDLVAPLAFDIIGTMGAGSVGKGVQVLAKAPKVVQLAAQFPKLAKVVGVTSKGVRGAHGVVKSVVTPMDSIWSVVRHPVNTAKAAWGATKNLGRNFKAAKKMWSTYSNGQKALAATRLGGKVLSYGGKGALNTAGVLADGVEAAAYPPITASRILTPSSTTQYTADTYKAIDEYMKHPRRVTERVNAARKAYLDKLKRSADSIEWDDTDSIATAGTAIGGGLLGALLGGKHWLLGGLLGAGAGGLAGAAYRIYKRKHG